MGHEYRNAQNTVNVIASITGHERPASCTANAVRHSTESATRYGVASPPVRLKISTSAPDSTAASAMLTTLLLGANNTEDVVVSSCRPPTRSRHSAASGRERRR